MDIDSWVVEKVFLLHLSSSRSDHNPLVFGHSSKKGRIARCSCFTGPGDPISLPKKQCCCRCFDNAASSSYAWGNCGCVESTSKLESFLAFSKEVEWTWDGIRRHVLSILASIPRPLTLPEASSGKFCSSASGASPCKYLQIPLQHTGVTWIVSWTVAVSAMNRWQKTGSQFQLRS